MACLRDGERTPFPDVTLGKAFIRFPAFARCCFRIAASLLVFTSPMTSPLGLLCHGYCVNGNWGGDSRMLYCLRKTPLTVCD